MSTSTSTISAKQGSFSTDPDRTEKLWRLVSAATKVPTAVMSDRASSTIRSSVVNKPVPTPFVPPRPGSAQFVSGALAPRGILIRARDGFFQQTAFEYFGTPTPLPTMTCASHYRRLLCSTSLWLERDITSINCITHRYRTMAAVRPPLPQQEWMLEAATSLLHSEDLVHPDFDAGHDDDSKTSWLPIRLCGGSFQPSAVLMTNKPQWEEPPIISSRAPSNKTSGRAPPSSNNTTNKPPALPSVTKSAAATAAATPLSVTPTFSYWLRAHCFLHHARYSSLSSSAFDPPPTTRRMNLHGLESHTPVRHSYACLPYLSIEVRSAAADDAADVTSLHRLAASGATALWNRARLRGSNDDYEDGAAALRHFGLLLAGCSWELYCMTAVARSGGEEGAVAWCGCEMAHLAGGRLTGREDVGQLVDWINEIHCWGNTAYATACVNDVFRTDG